MPTSDCDKKTIVGYIDDNKDNNLNKYLERRYDNYVFIQVDANDTIKTLIDKILDKKCQIVVLDSKLYTDSGNFMEKITGQNLEVILTSFYPFISSIVISQEEDVKGLNYIKKYQGNVTNNKEVEKYYNDNLNAILKEYENKQTRLRLTNENETQKAEKIDKFFKDSIEEEINNLPSYDISKKDIDRLIEKIGELEKKICG